MVYSLLIAAQKALCQKPLCVVGGQTFTSTKLLKLKHNPAVTSWVTKYMTRLFLQCTSKA